MDPRSAANVLKQIAAFLQLRGESTFKVRAYEQAAKSVAALDTDDLAALDASGALASTPGVGKATLGVLRDLNTTGESRYLSELRTGLPAGLLDLLQIPGLATEKIHLLHESLGVDSVEALETVARNGRLTALKGFGPKTVQKILKGIEFFRANGTRTLYHHAVQRAAPLLAAVRAHPDVDRAELAGPLRRHCETVGNIVIVASCTGDPCAVAASFTRAPGVLQVTNDDTTSPCITFADGTRLELHCTPRRDFAFAFWLATGSPDHTAAVLRRLAARGLTVKAQSLVDPDERIVDIADEYTVYTFAGLPFVPPEMREEGYELTLADRGAMPVLIEPSDIRGCVHCHSTYSDGKTTIAELAEAARVRGWSYIGISDHSQSAFYASGMSVDAVLREHDEIDALNAANGDVRILKGIEADILADGALDYGADVLDRFDFVIGSIHSRFAMDRATMTARMLRALDDPHLTILGHPTGRLLLSRDAYPVDIELVLEKAATVGVAVELNADPKRLDLDWRLLPLAKRLGVPVSIGPDAHSVAGLDNVAIGVGMARKAGIEAADVLNTGTAGDLLDFARARRTSF
jgi:DNA polymerase (family 10)